MLVELPASVKISVLAHGHSGILLKLSAQVALGGKAQIGGNLAVGIRRVHQEIFHQVHFFPSDESGQRNFLTGVKKLRQIIGIQPQRIGNLLYLDLIVKMGEDIVLAFSDVRIFIKRA